MTIAATVLALSVLGLAAVEAATIKEQKVGGPRFVAWRRARVSFCITKKGRGK